MNAAPLAGIKVVDFSQFLSGPMATQKLADMGAEVLKIERKGVGDICRTLYLTNETVDGESMLFHAINRNKSSIEVDLKDSADLEFIRTLISTADVVIQNFRPGIMEKYGLDFKTLNRQFPRLVYGSVTGYGSDPSSEFYSMPGQDLLAQSISGMATNLSFQNQPQAQGIALADMMAGNNLAEGILAGLVKLNRTGKGSQIEVSLFEALMDGMSEKFTNFLNGTVPDKDSTLIVTLTLDTENYLLQLTENNKKSLVQLTQELELQQVSEIKFTASITRRKSILDALEKLGIDHFKVESWDHIFKDNLQTHDFLTQTIQLQSGVEIKGTRLPIRFDGQILKSDRPAPKVGEHTNKYKKTN